MRNDVSPHLQTPVAIQRQVKAMNHYCEYDQEEQYTDGPCGKPARIKMEGTPEEQENFGLGSTRVNK